jgi:coenzyme F420-0:L-glutamate ligase/coenzyme F420-1:gamma-L-glutamate ligase
VRVAPRSATFIALSGLPEVQRGADLAALIESAMRAQSLSAQTHDVFVLAQKIVSKAEGRTVALARVTPSAEAQRLAAVTRKDPRLVEVILSESEAVVRAAPHVLIVRHRLGFVMANAGVDRSNLSADATEDEVLLLPSDPDGAAARLHRELTERFGVALGVLISDSFGRPFRRGVVNVALGVAGVPALIDRRGERDRRGRALEITEVAFADALAAGAALVMGEAAESTPVVLARGLDLSAPASDGRSLLRPLGEDLFQ